MSRYILDATEPRLSQSDIMLEKVWKKVRESIREKYETGALTLMQMLRELDEFPLEFHYKRLDIPDVFLQDLIKKTEEGKLTLTESSWGENELEKKHLEGTRPTINDMFPSSCGYNSYGGPTYDIVLSRDKITVKANSAYQTFDGWDTLDTTFHWETRTFDYEIACEDVDSILEQLLSHYAGNIVKRYTDVKYSTAFDLLSIIWQKES